MHCMMSLNSVENILKQRLVQLKPFYWITGALASSPSTFGNRTDMSLVLMGITDKFYVLPINLSLKDTNAEEVEGTIHVDHIFVGNIWLNSIV